MKKYKAELYYGYLEADYGEIYHAFELTDPEEKVDCEAIGRDLAERLKTGSDDLNFNWNLMLVKIPDSLVKKILMDFINQIIACYEDLEGAE